MSKSKTKKRTKSNSVSGGQRQRSDAKPNREKTNNNATSPNRRLDVDSQSNAAPTKLIVCVILVIVFVWSYWPVLVDLVDNWNRIPDYSHGFLVAPLAILFLWLRRDSFPGVSPDIAWLGLSLVLFAAIIRSVGAYYYLDALQGWSIPVWLCGFVWMLGGWATFRWSLPALVFLIFMVPLPYTVEHMLGQPLQLISTQISLFILQCLGQPAVAEGTTISLAEHQLEIERACSGLRIFFGVAALAFAFMILFERPIWSKVLLVVAILPIALLANSLRIVATGLLFQTGFGATANRIGHDFAGWFMIPLAALLFILTLAYLDRVFPEIRPIDASNLIRSQTKRHSTT